MNVALLILRLVAGFLITGHGAQKLFGWFGGAGIAKTGRVFESLGLRPGHRHALAAGLNELTGGLLLAAGLLAPLAEVLIIATMTAAVITVHAKNGPWAADGGWELAALYALIAFAVAGIGAGTLSLDHVFGLDVMGIGWALGALALGIAGGSGAVVVGRHQRGSRTAPAPS